MVREKRKSISAAFAKTTGGMLACVALIAIAVFAALAERLLERRDERAITEQAWLCTAALVPGSDGELFSSIDRLRSRYDRLVAVATLDSSGRLQTVYPARPAYRAAARVTLKGVPGPVVMKVPDEDARLELWGIVVPLNGINVRTSRKAVLLFTHDSCAASWLAATAASAVLVGAACLLGLGLMTHWFERRVVRPLHSLGDFARMSGGPTDRIPTIQIQGWREMEQVGDSLRRLVQGIAESNRHRRWIERDAEWQLRDWARGFNRKLRRAEEQATTDLLTGLRNRSFLASEFELLYERHRASGEDLSVVMIDVDNFKSHNDTHGHSAGDEVLSFVGDLLRTSIRPTDHAIRYGGDEFLLLLLGASAEQAARVAERIVRLFGQYSSLIEGSKPLSMSAGVASLGSDPGDDGYALISKADKALYVAKRAGKSEVATCSPV